MGTLVSAFGVYLSVYLDLPIGAPIVCTFGAVRLLMFEVHQAMHWSNNKTAA